MKPGFLTTQALIKGKIASFIQDFFRIKSPGVKREVNGFEFISAPETTLARQNGFVGIYKNQNNGKVIIKKHCYKLKDLDYIYLLNEIKILETFKKLNIKNVPNISGINISTTKLVDYKIKSKEIYLVVDFAEGKTIENLDEDKKIEILNSAIQGLDKIYKQIPKKIKKSISKRGSLSFLSSFILYLAKSVIRDPENLSLYLKLGLQFYLYNLLSSIKQELTLSHRELSEGNILYNPKTKSAVITDWENAVLSDKLYDLSHLPRLFFKSIVKEKILNLVSSYLPDILSRRRFIALAIYDCIQSIAIFPKESPKYNEVRQFSKVLEDYFLPNLLSSQKKSFFESIHSFILKIIYLIKKLSPIKQNSGCVILCYHSVSDENWKYALTTNEFKLQLAYIKKNFKISTLSEIISGKNISNKAVITFDDGYLSTYKNALPILERYDIKATVFVIGNERNANKKELDNDLKFMDLEQIKNLHGHGWEIGFHTDTHGDLLNLSEEELMEEIIVGKRNLEDKLGFKMKFFAYPKGKYTSIIIKILEKAGFDAAFTVEGGNINFNNPMLLTRTQVEKGVGIQEFSAMLSPLGLLAEDILMTFLKIKEKLSLKINKYVARIYFLYKKAFSVKKTKWTSWL